MKTLKKIGYFILMVLCVIGAIAGIGYTIYYGQWFASVGIAVLAYTAWPKFYDYLVKLTL
jgi:MFS superfamily sulfate permease-like transporter